MHINVKAAVCAAASFAVVIGLGELYIARAHAESGFPDAVVTVDGRNFPVCELEDCSDQPDQVGVWFNRSGDPWLSLGQYSVPVTSGPESVHGVFVSGCGWDWDLNDDAGCAD